jgi:hypothetical protein
MIREDRQILIVRFRSSNILPPSIIINPARAIKHRVESPVHDCTKRKCEKKKRREKPHNREPYRPHKMGKRSGKKPLAFLSRKLRLSKRSDSPLLAVSGHPSSINNSTEATTAVLGAGAKNIKKKIGQRLWIRFDRTGQSEILECDKSVIIKRAGIPARDLRILGPVFSQSSNILGELPVLSLQSLIQIIFYGVWGVVYCSEKERKKAIICI